MFIPAIRHSGVRRPIQFHGPAGLRLSQLRVYSIGLLVSAGNSLWLVIKLALAPCLLVLIPAVTLCWMVSMLDRRHGRQLKSMVAPNDNAESLQDSDSVRVDILADSLLVPPRRLINARRYNDSWLEDMLYLER